MENVPVSSGRPSAEDNNSASGRLGDTNKNGKSGKNKLKLAGMLAGVLLLLVLLFTAWTLYRSSTAAHIDNGKYQAVFFTNGQVYFGKLQNLNGSYMKMTDIFYLQAQEAESAEESQNPQETANRNNNDVQLIKLGNEVHGPVDEMVISKEQILFFENLKTDGKVADSISKYHSQKR